MVSLFPLNPSGLAETDSVADPDEQQIQTRIDWLAFHRLWGQLPETVLKAVAAAQVLLKIDAGTEIYQAGQIPLGVYWLKWGTVEIFHQTSVGKSHIHYRQAGDLFGHVPLLSGQPQTTYQADAIALSACEILYLQRTDLELLLRTYPAIQTLLNQLLAQDLATFAQRLAREQMRMQKLQHYVQPIPVGQSVIGSSKGSVRLAQQVDQAAMDQRPVLLQAPPGSGQTFLAGLIHTRSGLKEYPFLEVDCAKLPRDEADSIRTEVLFGRAPGEPGVLELLERGTLLVSNAHCLSTPDRDRLIHYFKTGSFFPISELGSPPPEPVQVWVRVILSSPEPWQLQGIDHHFLKVFRLSQRKEDIPVFAHYFLKLYGEDMGRTELQLEQSGRRRLISYAYPGNVAELATILKRAVLMTPPGQTVIPEQVLWSVQSPKNTFRLDLLDQIPWLRPLLLHPWWPQGIWILVMLLFIPVTVMGYAGPQTRADSMTLNFFWAWWWPMYLFLFAFVGRLWCAICPFMITGEWLRKLSLWVWPRQLRPWPNRWLNRWGGWILWAGFVAIYLWEKLWDLPHTPYLSSWLLLIITAGAVLGSLIYERRLWCRYLCPIGGMNGLFAKLSMIEVRSMQQVCGSQCGTFGCFRGSNATPPSFAGALPTEGQATGGCPLYSHPAQLQDNRDCVLCMTCLKACPHRSVQLNLRFPAADLLDNHQASWAEAALLLLLLGGVLMHHSDTILGWVGQGHILIDADHFKLALPIVSALLSLPALLIVAVDGITRFYDPNRPPLLRIIYAYLPLTLAVNLAHYIPAAMTEAGQILPVIARTFGQSGVGWPTLTWGGEVASFLQGITLLSALAFGIYPLQRITQRSLLANIPHLVLMTGFIWVGFLLMM
jgi:polyferredoxin/CRP-like cAMP-binding protein